MSSNVWIRPQFIGCWGGRDDITTAQQGRGSHTSTSTFPAPGIPKLDDANDAGGRNSAACTLILTEGDSAKTLAISGLSVVGRDKYGVFPLR